MVQPLNSSFTLRPCIDNPHRQRLTIKRPSPPPISAATPLEDCRDEDSQDQPSRQYQPRCVSLPEPNPRKRTMALQPHHRVRSFAPFESIELRQVPSDFDPPDDKAYWKKRCYHWQTICQQERKKMREMVEDQRQLRRRIWQLEEQITQPKMDESSVQGVNQIPASPQTARDGPPSWIVTAPKTQNSCFYLTDCEGLSDSEDYDIVMDVQDKEELSSAVE